jgi:hypothetical protein
LDKDLSEESIKLRLTRWSTGFAYLPFKPLLLGSFPLITFPMLVSLWPINKRDTLPIDAEQRLFSFVGGRAIPYCIEAWDVGGERDGWKVGDL